MTLILYVGWIFFITLQLISPLLCVKFYIPATKLKDILHIIPCSSFIFFLILEFIKSMQSKLRKLFLSKY
jgi:hypothetical protein